LLFRNYRNGQRGVWLYSVSEHRYRSLRHVRALAAAGRAVRVLCHLTKRDITQELLAPRPNGGARKSVHVTSTVKANHDFVNALRECLGFDPIPWT